MAPITVNILMVDDQPAKLLSYEAILSDMGLTLIKAASARQALEILLKTDIAIVLMDVSMPELDGFELAQIIRQHPRYQQTAIIFISAVHLTDLDRLKGYELGAVDYLPVPIIPDILRAKVGVFADLYRKTRQLEALNQELEQRVEERTSALVESTAQLREREEQFSVILRHTSAVIYLLDEHDRFIRVNRRFAEIFGAQENDIYGCSLTDILPSDIVNDFIEAHRQVRATQTSCEFEETFTQSGERRTYTSIKTPLFDEQGQPAGILSVSTDMTERKRAEEDRQVLLIREREARMIAEAALQVRDDFLAVAAHELKTPVTGLRLTAQFITRRMHKNQETLPEWLDDRMRIIEQQSDRLSRLIAQLLDVSRIDQQKLTIELAPSDIASLVERAVTAVQARTTRHQIMITAHPDLIAEIDADGIEQVVSNLLDNAVKFSPDGGQIEVVTQEADRTHFSLSVRDHGIGVAPDQREAIFGRFHQAHAHDHRSGLGLGLYICKQIVEGHQGKIAVEFPEDGGTRFVVTLPGVVSAVKTGQVRTTQKKKA